MTGQTVVGYFILGMTVHTPSHRHVCPWLCRGFFTLSNFSVTGLALQFAQNNMAPVRKEDMIRLLINAPPGNGGILLLKLSDFFFFLAFRDRFLMTFKASIDARHPRKGLGLEEAVAGVTFQSLFQMLFVIERDGLVGFRADTKADKEKQ